MVQVLEMNGISRDEAETIAATLGLQEGGGHSEMQISAAMQLFHKRNPNVRRDATRAK